jgi:hypothetical protein
MPWHVFNYDRYVGEYRTRRKAVFAAQCEIGTEDRPQRLHKGYYILRGESSFYDIATTEGAITQGFDLEDLKRRTAEDQAENRIRIGNTPIDHCTCTKSEE